jgi:hypothetical protein
VIAETTQIALFCGIYKLALGKGHEVEVLDSLVVVLTHATAEGALVDDFANVFEDEIAWSHVLVGAKTETLLLRLYNRDIGILFPLKAHVLAFPTAAAVT